MPFPFTDLSAFKVRPAVVLTPEASGPDLVVAYISSVLPGGGLPLACLLVAPEHPEFGGTGLRQASIVRLDKLMTIARARIRRRLGQLGPRLRSELDSRFRSTFGL